MSHEQQCGVCLREELEHVTSNVNHDFVPTFDDNEPLRIVHAVNPSRFLPASEPSRYSTAPTEVPAPNALGTQVGGNHYKGLVIEPVFYALVNKLPFVEGSVVKYVTRWRDKGGLADLKKAKHFLEILIDFHEQRINLTEMVNRITTIMESES